MGVASWELLHRVTVGTGINDIRNSYVVCGAIGGGWNGS